jgi:predicted secreted protein
VLRLLGHRFEQTPTGAAAGARPAAGRERWTFRATAPGEAVVRLRYARPLDPAPATDSARFVVRVR